MVSGGIALLFLIIAVILIIFLTAKVNLNPFITLLGVAILYGLAIGIKPVDVVQTIRDGFGGTLGYIGIVIACGTIIGTILEKTGGALSMTNAILGVVGQKRAPLAMSIAGYVVSIPVYCDSGFVILSPLNKGLSRKTGISMAVMAVALATGLYATHCLVPPTPGPIASAGILGADLGLVIGLGIIASIPSLIAGLLWATLFAKRYQIQPELEEDFDEVSKKYGKLPSATLSFLPLLLPIILILLKSLANPDLGLFAKENAVGIFLRFIGDPVIALLIGVLLALLLVRKDNLKEAVSDWMGAGIRNAALILAITGAGGAFGEILKASPMSEFIKGGLGDLNLGIFLPFILSAALKTAQGSSTVAIITTSSIMAPLLAGLGLNPVLTVLAIGAGAMTVSHANDSYFWVVSQFSDMKVSIAYKAYTTATLVEGVAAMITVFVISLFF